MQFNPEMSEQEARKKANELYKNTKGFKSVESVKEKQIQDDMDLQDQPETTKRVWKHGSESEMFNKLEEIARSEYPRTPVLEARITSTLEPQNVNDDVTLF